MNASLAGSFDDDLADVLLDLVRVRAGRDIFVGALVALAFFQVVTHFGDVIGAIPPWSLDFVPAGGDYPKHEKAYQGSAYPASHSQRDP